MFLKKSDQSAKMSVLQKIIDLMDDEKAKGLKKPEIAAVTVEAPDEDQDGHDGGDTEESPLKKLAADASAAPDAGEKDEGGEDDELLQRLISEYAKVK